MNFLMQWRLPAVWFAGVLATMAAAPGAWAASESVLYSFQKTGGDGIQPTGLVYSNGLLYGTTAYGGAGSACRTRLGCGTVFSLTLGGTETILYNFGASKTDAALPNGLIDVDGTFYGTTYNGGKKTADCSDASGCGTVYRLDPPGNETVLHSFGGSGDGNGPNPVMARLGHTLYGATVFGGQTQGYGTVFKIGLHGRETALYDFQGGGDGAEPSSGLVKLGGVFYGTTSTDGAFGQGTVYQVTPGGTETVIYSFRGNHGGGSPYVLIAANGKLYGSTLGGGNGCGVVFKISTDGRYRVLYAFQCGVDGAAPLGLAVVNGTVYGVTAGGGQYGDGTVFAITSGDTEQVVYSFQGGSDGSDPHGLVAAGGALFVNTWYGGSAGKGAVVKVVP